MLCLYHDIYIFVIIIIVLSIKKIACKSYSDDILKKLEVKHTSSFAYEYTQFLTTTNTLEATTFLLQALKIIPWLLIIKEANKYVIHSV